MSALVPLFRIVIVTRYIEWTLEQTAEERRNARFQACLQRDADERVAAIKKFFRLETK